MPAADRLIAFAVTAFVVIVIPGPSVLFVVSRTLASGRRAAVLSVAGNTAGEYLQVVAVAIGIGTLAQQSVAAFGALKLVGGAYLIYLGLKTFRERKRLAASLFAPPEPRGDRRSFVQGFLVGVTNPKTVVFLAAILPQFAMRSAGRVPTQILVLGLIFAVLALVSDTIWVLGAAVLRAWLGRSPRRLELIGGTAGVAISAVGVGVLLTGRKH